MGERAQYNTHTPAVEIDATTAKDVLGFGGIVKASKP